MLFHFRELSNRILNILTPKLRTLLAKLHYLIINFASTPHSREKTQTADDVIAQIVEAYTGFQPRTSQVTAIRKLIIKTKDVIFIGKTSFGKSVIFLIAALLLPGHIAIILLPLNIIGTQQTEKSDQYGITQSIHLKTETFRRPDIKQILWEIKQGAYTHVYISPETAVGNRFKEVLDDMTFRSKLCMVAIDKIHLVHHWGQDGKGFQPEYGQINLFRERLPDHVPFFGYSATIDDKAMASIIKTVGFRNPEIIRTPLDRPNITYAIIPIPKDTKGSYSALTALLPDQNLISKASKPLNCSSTIELPISIYNSEPENNNILSTS